MAVVVTVDMEVVVMWHWVSNLSVHQNHLEGMGKHGLLGPTWVGQGRVCDSSSNKCPGDADVVGLGPHFENHEANSVVVLKPVSIGESPGSPSREE